MSSGWLMYAAIRFSPRFSPARNQTCIRDSALFAVFRRVCRRVFRRFSPRVSPPFFAAFVAVCFAAFFAACFTARWPDHAGPIDDDASVAAEARHRWPYSCCSFVELTFMDIKYAAKGMLACLRFSVGRMHPMMSGSWVAARGRGTSGYFMRRKARRVSAPRVVLQNMRFRVCPDGAVVVHPQMWVNIRCGEKPAWEIRTLFLVARYG